jgi:hypothetical protein
MDIRKGVNSGKIIELKGRDGHQKGGELWENNIIKGEVDIRKVVNSGEII